MSEQQSSQLPPRHVISDEELGKLLEEHKKFIKTSGSEGTEGLFCHLNLRDQELYDPLLTNTFIANCDFSGSVIEAGDFRNSTCYADFIGTQFHLPASPVAPGPDSFAADFSGCDLHNSNFKRAEFERASFRNANLEGTNFSDAVLHDVDFQGARSLRVEQFAGADLTGSSLPSYLKYSEGVAHATAIALQAKRLLLAILVTCVYSWLTIGTTTDANLLTNSSSSPLPIIGAQLPVVAFYIVAPILILCLYVYFHLHVQRLWEELGKLPAIFPDGRTLDRMVHPWLLIGLVNSYIPLLRDGRPALSKVQTLVSLTLGWWTVPITVMLFWLRFVRARTLVPSLLHLLMLALVVIAALYFQQLMERTLRRSLVGDSRKRRVFTVPSACELLVCVHVIVSTSMITLIAFGGEPSVLAYRLCPSVAGQDVSTRPTPWLGNTVQLGQVKPAILNHRNLRGLDAQGAFLAKAQFVGSDLTGANFFLCDLCAANLADANLKDANLSQANLRGANLGLGTYLRASQIDPLETEVWAAANVTVDQITSAWTDSSTSLPPYLLDSMKLDSVSGTWVRRR